MFCFETILQKLCMFLNIIIQSLNSQDFGTYQFLINVNSHHAQIRKVNHALIQLNRNLD